MSKIIEFIVNPSELGAGSFGSSLGPEAIRVAARKMGADFFGKYKIHELKNVNYLLDHPTSFALAKRIDAVIEIAKEVSNTVSSVCSDNKFPFVLAGDHSSGAFTIAGIRKAFPEKKLGVIWIDAHGDLHSPYTSPSGNLHGMPLAIALGEDNKEMQRNHPDEETKNHWSKLKNIVDICPLIDAKNLVFIGVRDTEKEENFLINKHEIRNIRVEEVRKNGVDHTLNEVKYLLQDCDLLYVSFDVDSMDPDLTSYGTGTPVKNGLTIDEAQFLLNGFAKDPRTTCIELVEVNPCLDNKTNRMAEVAFDLIQSVTKTLEEKLDGK